jgi:lipopolysaccharide export system permease protein
MKKLDRYIGRSVGMNVLLVQFVLTALFVFFMFIEEAHDIGQGNYNVFQALQYVLLQAPKAVYDLFPVAVLLGALLGLGVLANSSELTVIRCAGVSIGRIAWAVLKSVLILLLLVILMDNYVTPHVTQYGKNLRAIAKSGMLALQSGRSAFWLRDGSFFIHIHELRPPGEVGKASIYDFDPERRLRRLVQTDRAYYDNGVWQVFNLTQTHLKADKISTTQIEQSVIDSTLTPDMLNILILKPEDLSGPELYSFIHHLRSNNQHAQAYELALWLKIVYPFTVVVMVLLALPFIFGSLRSVSIGQRILAGSLLGIGFHIFNETVNHMGLLYNLSPVLSAILPSTLFLIGALLLFWYRLGSSAAMR